MIKDIQILPEAWGDIIKISSYYSTISDDLSLEFEHFLFASLDNIRMLPAICPIKYKNVRRKLLRKFPYAIYFLEYESFIRIIAVIHQRENPESIGRQINDRKSN
jgi:plasmid stabilization system protein ParE